VKLYLNRKLDGEEAIKDQATGETSSKFRFSYNLGIA